MKALAARGDRVRVVDDLSSGYQSNIEGVEGVALSIRDITTPGSCDDLMEGVDAVFHLAASVGNKRTIDNPLRDSEINVMGTLRLLEAARRSGVKKVVVSSSAGIFGELVTMPIAEEHPLEPDTPYGASKLCQEKHALAYAKLYGIDVVCLRYFNIYGVNQRFDEYGNVIPIFAFKMLREEPITIFGDGEQTRDFLNVRDVVQANLRAAEVENASGAYNLGCGDRVSINHLVSLLEEASGLRAMVEHGPERPGDVRHSMAAIDKARSRLGFEPEVDLREGLAEYFAWARTAQSSQSG
ncbi:MAG: NAD-dependent epimerase/dehydratase family protein [Myxococcales bacterium]|nr:NAD-dependent epimerase/dehydratase family protein [Myxococcales bacterium]